MSRRLISREEVGVKAMTKLPQENRPLSVHLVLRNPTLQPRCKSNAEKAPSLKLLPYERKLKSNKGFFRYIGTLSPTPPDAFPSAIM